MRRLFLILIFLAAASSGRAAEADGVVFVTGRGDSTHMAVADARRNAVVAVAGALAGGEVVADNFPLFEAILPTAPSSRREWNSWTALPC